MIYLMNSRIWLDNLEDWMEILSMDHEGEANRRHVHLSSTFALPRTKRPPVLPRTQGNSCANM